MKGDNIIKAFKKLGNLFLLRNLMWLMNIHLRNHFKANRINRCPSCHFHCTVVKIGGEIIEEILAPNVQKIRHFIASLM